MTTDIKATYLNLVKNLHSLNASLRLSFRDKKNGLNPKDRLLNTVWIPFLEEMDLVDPFREQNPNRIVWSFVGNGNSRIDRVYVDSASMGRVTNLKYIRTPFHGHRVLSFQLKNVVEWGKSYFKLNTSLFEDEEYEAIVEEAIDEVGRLTNRNIREKWEIFMMSMKTTATAQGKIGRREDSKWT